MTRTTTTTRTRPTAAPTRRTRSSCDLGPTRVRKLRPVIALFSPPFRATLVGHLEALAHLEPGDRVRVGFARAIHDARRAAGDVR